MAKPIVKWAGGKSQLLNELIPLIPEFKVYYEPFVGGGALFFALQPKKAVLNDFNEQLINLYAQARDHSSSLIRKLNKLQKSHINTTEHYNSLREQYNKCLLKNEKSTKSASLMLYLNKAGFNGLYRLNQEGLYNVPSGHREKVNLFEKDNMLAVSEALSKATLLVGDFEKACSTCKKGDFVFFDSPYYNTFDTYQAGGFSEDDHLRLAKLFAKLTNKGVKCLLTNSNEDFIKELYKDYDIKIINVKRMINCDGKKRTGKEVIIKNY